MPMSVAPHALQALALAECAGLPLYLSYTQGNISGENLPAVLGDPDEVILAVVNRRAALAIVHSSSTDAGCGGLL
jgi:hypothetical protein